MKARPFIRVMAALVGGGLVAAACGAPNESAREPSPPTSPPSTASLSVPAPRPSTAPGAVSISSAVAPYGRFGTDAGPGVFPRTLQHAMGQTHIEREPQRIVTLDTGELDAMVTLGIKPVGAVDYGATGLPDYFDPKDIEGIEVVGTLQEPNLESIVRLKPDLILSSKLRHEKFYPQLSQIAPTVFAERVGVTWKENFQLFAEAVGREEQAGETVERYEQRVTEMRASLPTPRPQVSITRILANGNIRLYQRANFLGILLTDLGFPRPEAQNVDDFAADVSLEQLSQAEGDLIVLAVFDGTKNTHVDAVLGSPLWQGLEAVRSGAVKQVDDQTWIGGIGYEAAFKVMDQLPDVIAAAAQR